MIITWLATSLGIASVLMARAHGLRVPCTNLALRNPYGFAALCVCFNPMNFVHWHAASCFVHTHFVRSDHALAWCAYACIYILMSFVHILPAKLQCTYKSGSRLGRAMNLVDRLRTSADERVLSGRRAVVIAWWATCGGWLFFIDPSFLVNSHLGHSRAWIPACSPNAALLHRCFPSNLSTTTQGAIVKLRGASSELCTLFIWSV